MRKKAQLAIFVILGIVILAIGGSFLLVSDLTAEKEETALTMPYKGEEIKPYVESCLALVSDAALKEIAATGGTFNEVSSRLYNAEKYSYLCTYRVGNGCFNSLTTRQSVESELNKKINAGLKNCLDINELKKMYNIDESSLSVQTTIAQNVIFNLKYPLTLKSGDSTKNIEDFSYTSSIEFGKLYDLAIQILNGEIENSFFNEDEWMAEHGAEIKIEKHKPYPDVVYKLSLKDKQKQEVYSFLFAVQGYDTMENVGQKIEENSLGYCFTEKDNNCYANSPQVECTSTDGIWSQDKPDNCNGLSIYSDELCDGKPCANCGEWKHGQSWCEYDGIAGAGFDPVGSRHFKRSCINGEIYYTECRDYREELCTGNEVTKQAICRVNRWQDCAQQTNPADCQDFSKRDCYWSGWLTKSNPYRTITNDYSNRKCLPYVPPGLKHWEGRGDNVCSMANEQFDCRGKGCSMAWVDSTAAYCYFQADCGNYFNFLKNLVFGGFTNTQGQPRSYVYGVPLIKTNPYLLQLPFNAKKRELEGNEFNFPQGQSSAMQQNMESYQYRMQNSDVAKIISIMPPNIQIDLDVLHTADCNVWKTPIDENNCGVCNAMPNKPCSEYRCKSIGANCIYTEEEGIGKCSYKKFNIEDVKFSIDFMGKIKKEVPIVDLISLIGNKTSSSFKKEFVSDELQKSEDIFGTQEGYKISDLEPNTNIVIFARSTIPIQCRLSNFPYIEFEQLPSVSRAYSENFPILINVKSIQQQKENAKTSESLVSPLQIFQLGDLSEQLDKAQISMQSIQQQGAMSESLNNMLIGLSNQLGIEVSSTDELFEKMKQNYEEAKPMLEDFADLTKDVYIAMESNKMYHFITCKDLTGAFKKDFFVTYQILPDTNQPVLIRVNPEDKSSVSPEFTFTMYLDEPAECRYSFEDKAFEQMQTMECSLEDVYGLYECSKDISSNNPKTDVYVKCKDQPFRTSSYYLNIKSGSKFDIISSQRFEMNGTVMDLRGIVLNNGVIDAFNPSALEDKEVSIEVNKPSVEVKLSLPKERVCKYSTEDISFEEMTKTLSCSQGQTGYACSNTFNVGNYFIKCQNTRAEQRNSANFKFSFSKK